MTSEPYRHIAVSDDEDEFVIKAGARDETPRPKATDASIAAPQPDSPVSSARSGSSEVVAPPEERADGAQPARVQAESAQGPRAKKAKAEDDYRATTADDLKGSPMTGMQKGIIVVAVLGLIAFFVYYLFLR